MHPIDAGIGQRHHAGFDQGRGRGAGGRPVHHALCRRHEGQNPQGVAAKHFQIGRGIADPENRLADAIVETGADRLGQKTLGRFAQGRIVKTAQIDDIERHGVFLACRDGSRKAFFAL